MDWEIERIAIELAKKFASWDRWGSDKPADGPNGNDPMEEREYWRDVARFVIAMTNTRAKGVRDEH